MTLDCKSLPESNMDADTALVKLSAPSECLPGSRRMLGHGVVASVFLKCCTGLVARNLGMLGPVVSSVATSRLLFNLSWPRVD